MDAGSLMIKFLYLRASWMLLCNQSGFRQLRLLLACLCMPLTAVHASALTPEQLQQNKVKSAFVLNIAKFVRWPNTLTQQDSDALTLCYYQEDVLGSAYDVIRNREVNGRQLRLKQAQQPIELSGCNILLLSATGLEQMIKMPIVDKASPLLVIADLTDQAGTGKAYPGLHVALVRSGKKIGFEINVAAADQAGLKFSSRLLKLAHIVGKET